MNELNLQEAHKILRIPRVFSCSPSHALTYEVTWPTQHVHFQIPYFCCFFHRIVGTEMFQLGLNTELTVPQTWKDYNWSSVNDCISVDTFYRMIPVCTFPHKRHHLY